MKDSTIRNYIVLNNLISSTATGVVLYHFSRDIQTSVVGGIGVCFFILTLMWLGELHD